MDKKSVDFLNSLIEKVFILYMFGVKINTVKSLCRNQFCVSVDTRL